MTVKAKRYGGPPTDPEKLRHLADIYNVNYDDLVREADAYDSRPPYIIELAKKRLHATAQLIASIIETKQAETALRESEEKYRLLFNTFPLGITVSDPSGNIVESNAQAAERSADLTRQLLAFARKQTIAPKVIDLNKTVEGMLKMLRRLIGEDINLLWQPGSNLRPVKVDPAQIDQLLANLCVNARDAIAGKGKIIIETATKIFDDAYCADHLGFLPGEYVLLDQGVHFIQKPFSMKDLGGKLREALEG